MSLRAIFNLFCDGRWNAVEWCSIIPNLLTYYCNLLLWHFLLLHGQERSTIYELNTSIKMKHLRTYCQDWRWLYWSNSSFSYLFTAQHSFIRSYTRAAAFLMVVLFQTTPFLFNRIRMRCILPILIRIRKWRHVHYRWPPILAMRSILGEDTYKGWLYLVVLPQPPAPLLSH